LVFLFVANHRCSPTFEQRGGIPGGMRCVPPSEQELSCPQTLRKSLIQKKNSCLLPPGGRLSRAACRTSKAQAVNRVAGSVPVALRV
jgi:hypothetical protein